MATPEYSDQPPSTGYQVPPDFGAAPPPPGMGAPELDPLVPPPHGGLRPWFDRLFATLGRSWRPLAVIFLLTFVVPNVVVAVLYAGIDGVAVGSGPVPFPALEQSGRITAGLLLGVGLLSLAAYFISAIGWGAGIYAVTQDATGAPAVVGAALRAGLARALPMFGWYLLYGLMVIVGILLCVVPGVYLAVAGSLFSFPLIYERGRSAMGRSFGLVHAAFGAALGRVLLLFAFLLVGSCLVGGGFGLLSVAFVDPVTGPGVGFQLVSNLVGALISVPLSMVLLVGLLLTYTQLRAAREQISTPLLWAAAQPAAPEAPPGFQPPA